MKNISRPLNIRSFTCPPDFIAILPDLVTTTIISFPVSGELGKSGQGDQN
jgi:hypothetical protein